MSSISSVITGGFGVPGSASLVITDGYGTAGVFVPPVVTSSPGGVRRARFLRRAPRLPWEQEEEESPVTVAPVKRKRIQLPVAKAQERMGPIPIQTMREISAPVITIPELGTATLKAIEDEDEDWLFLI